LGKKLLKRKFAQSLGHRKRNAEENKVSEIGKEKKGRKINNGSQKKRRRRENVPNPHHLLLIRKEPTKLLGEI